MKTEVGELFFYGGIFVIILTVIRILFHYDPVEVIIYLLLAIVCFYLAHKKGKEK